MSASFSLRLPNKKRRVIGGTAPCFVIAEIGTNWHFGDSNDPTFAKRLIDVAADAGCDAVKFQTYRPEEVYAPNAGTSDYLDAAGIRRTITDVIAERVMPPEMIAPLAGHAAERNLIFMSSCFSIDDLALVNPLTPVHKLASYEISHLRLIDALAKTRKPLLMSTGASTLDDVAWAVQRFRYSGGRHLVLMQCTARYPAPDEAMNLAAIPKLARRFRCIAGFSDHSPHPLRAPLAAVALGAKVLEKHITLDRKAAGPDHFNSIEPNELVEMVAGVRAVERMLGDGEKRIQWAERELATFARRAIQATKPIAIGDTLREGENLAILRPGKRRPGVHPRMLPKLEGKIARRRIAAGDGIDLNAIRTSKIAVSRQLSDAKKVEIFSYGH